MTPPHRPALPVESTGPRHWVIGDVHGCADALMELLPLLPRDDRLVFCGDVINRGPHIEATMQIVWRLVESGRAAWLMGNHERSLVEGLERDAPTALALLAGCETYRQLGDRRARLWLERLRLLPLTYWGQGWVATHAGFDPLSWQPDLTVRMAFWQSYDGRFGDVIVGHTPGPDVRRLGHVVLVDTGACYGGQLTAYCAETRQVRRVPGLRCPAGSGSPLPLGPRGLLP
jgi:serine/threonine protein phosphatase 1